jgi:hypothetical protein
MQKLGRLELRKIYLMGDGRWIKADIARLRKMLER